VEHKNRSLGVVAMNIKQAQRIADELSALADRDPVLAKALALTYHGHIALNRGCRQDNVFSLSR